MPLNSKHRPGDSGTLYVSDLDGTLLTPERVLSEHTRHALNAMIGDGLAFTYATARPLLTARRATAGLRLDLPVVVSGGAFVVAPDGTEIVAHHLHPDDATTIQGLCRRHEVPPLVHQGHATRMRVAWVEHAESWGIRAYLSDRPGDPRLASVTSWPELPSADVSGVTIIGDRTEIPALATDIASATDGRVALTTQTDVYHPELVWLDVTAREATKAHALTLLRDLVGASRLVVFGDNLNDLSMFAVADESYAVANAVPQVLAAASGVVAANTDDGVSQALARRYRPKCGTVNAIRPRSPE